MIDLKTNETKCLKLFNLLLLPFVERKTNIAASFRFAKQKELRIWIIAYLHRPIDASVAIIRLSFIIIFIIRVFFPFISIYLFHFC